MRRAALLLLLASAGCGASSDPPEPPAEDARAGRTDLFRDFLDDGKRDAAGQPLNARRTDAADVCAGASGGIARITGRAEACRGALAGAGLQGRLVLDLWVRARGYRPGALLEVDVRAGGVSKARGTLRNTGVRATNRWQSFSVGFDHDGSPLEVVVRGAGNGTVELDHLDLFPRTMGLVLGPGSGEFGDDDWIEIEHDKGRALTLTVGTRDASEALAALVRSGAATDQRTDFRRLVRVRVRDLALSTETGNLELHARAGGHAARMQVRRAAPPCEYEGPADGVPVLVTGFQPFPADGWHDNVSAVAVLAARPPAGTKLLRLVLPVEYDRAPAEVASAIERCRPALVVSFGQGGSAIHLERTGYNLMDTSELSGGVPDNRGLVSAAAPIEAGAADSRATGLDLDRAASALSAIGEHGEPSDDPGRYVCNDVFFTELGALGRIGGRGGFIHLPYTTDFDDATRARFGAVVEAIVASQVAR